jgi:serine/threonine-protein kinase SRPK3
VKILTARATELNRQGRLQELEALQAISKELTDLGSCLPELVDHFEITGPHGDHLCFVLKLRSTDVSSFRRTSPTRALLLHDVQMVILHVLNALAILHKLGFIHTGLSQSLLSFQSLTLLFRCQGRRCSSYPWP